jgi:uracil-DNA glycosylase family 4
VIRPVDALLEFLEAEKARGVSHVHLDDGARDGLRALFEQARAGSKPTVIAPIITNVDEALEIEGKQAATVLPEITLVGNTPSAKIDELRREAENWAPARALGTLREKMVFSTGNPEARIMFIGEAPGYQEEKEGEPFVGPAGQKLNDILKAMGLSREEVYISCIVKFRPATARQTTNNRKPTPEEIFVCMPFIRKEIEIVQPEIIIALGDASAEGLLGLDGTVAPLRGRWHDFDGRPVRATHHPSYLLQNGANNPIKGQVWEDMLVAMEKIGLPISDKQRGYFLPKP